jgi:hypothetical protein
MPIARRDVIMGAGAAALLPAAALKAQAGQSWRIPITLTDTRVQVECSIAGKGPLPFVIDTGGTIGLIETKLAETLRLRKLGATTLALRGARKPYPIYEATDFVFGGQLRQPSATFAAVDHINFRDGAVGSLAAGVLTAVDGELDFAASEWRVHRGGTPDRTGWTRYDKAIVSYGNVNGSSFLLADATLGGQSFRFGLDTGWPSPMQIYRKTAEAIGLWNAERWTPAAPDGKARLVRGPALSMAGATIDGPLLAILENPEWDVFGAGIIGLPILRRFNMATVAADKALYLKPNGLPAQPDRYNRAGLWIDRDGKDAKIAVVGAGSPAAKAGLKPGDRLIGVDFGALTSGMFGPAGTGIALKVAQSGGPRDLVLTLADFL